ncbi:MAG: GtrA family protein [Bacteroidales bacterium]|nr:GtrA family protein [Bacteroidales bacterium]
MIFEVKELLTQATLFKFLKFCVVGVTGTIIDFGLTWICKEKLKIPKFIANAIGFVVAATSNYILNRIWTWGSTNEQVGVEYVKFFGVSLIGLGLNTLILYLLHEKLKLNFWISKVFATGVVMVWNFLANHYFTFAGVGA